MSGQEGGGRGASGSRGAGTSRRSLQPAARGRAGERAVGTRGAGPWAAGPWESLLSFLGHPLPCPAPSNPPSSTPGKPPPSCGTAAGAGPLVLLAFSSLAASDGSLRLLQSRSGHNLAPALGLDSGGVLLLPQSLNGRLPGTTVVPRTKGE